MAITEIYVDPSIAGDSGDGSIGDPYGDLEYAIEQETFDTTNGTRVNIKAGTDEVLAANLSTALADTGTSVAWVPTEAAPLIFQGYTATAGDGGICGIDGDGSVPIFSNANTDYVFFVNCHLHNTGSNAILLLDNFCGVLGCEIDNTTTTAMTFGNHTAVVGCYIHNVGGKGIEASAGTLVFANYFADGSNEFTLGVEVETTGVVLRNRFKLADEAGAIKLGPHCYAIHNSIFSDGSDAKGIAVDGNDLCGGIINNLVEGFSGSGGIGIDYSIAGSHLIFSGGNSVYNCDTDIAAMAGHLFYGLGGDESLSASPFAAASSDNFSPVDTGNVKEGSVPSVIGGGLV